MVSIDVHCRDQIVVESERTANEQGEVMQTWATCLKCGGCVVESVVSLGSEAHMQRVSDSFCSPGEYQLVTDAQNGTPGSVTIGL